MQKSIKENLITRIRKIWYCNEYIVGGIKQKYFMILMRKYQFEEWHVLPINFRPYAIRIVDYLNEQKTGRVVEIGCGLGEIIGNINTHERLGYDIDSRVILAAKKIYRKVVFHTGSFEDVKNQKVDYLITVNFIHNIPPEELREKYLGLIENNEIKHIILDVVYGKGYKYKHDVKELFCGSGYKVKKRLSRDCAAQNGSRWIYILERECK